MFRLIRLLIIGAFFVAALIWFGRVTIAEHLLSKKLSMDVKIESVKLGWREITFCNLHLSNPLQAHALDAFTAESISIFVHPLELISKRVHIDQVKVVNPTCYLELYNSSGSDNNWVHILNHMPIATQGTKHFVIDKLQVTNLSFKAIRPKGKALSLPPLPYLEFEHLGESGSLSLSSLSKSIFELFLSSLTSKKHFGALLDHVHLLPKDLTSSYEKNYLKDGFNAIKRKTQESIEDFISSITED